MAFNEYWALGELHHHIRRFRKFSEEAAREVGLEAQQHQAMVAIKALNEPLGPTVTAISDFLLIRHHSAVGLVDRLVERGLAERSRGTEDKRQVRVHLTAAGEELLEQLGARHREELHQRGPALAAALADVFSRVAPAELAETEAPPADAEDSAG